MDITIVLVTFNRIEDLKKTLKMYELQTVLPKCIIVVDNNSTDGTRGFLENWIKIQDKIERIVISNEVNVGGSGGFYIGLKKAIELNNKWIFLADDDAYLDKSAFEYFDSYLHRNDSANISALCTSVISYGQIDCLHRRRIKKSIFKIIEENVAESEYLKHEFEIDEFSYVGALLNKEKLEKVGLTEKNFFIYYDDTEHSIRLKKVGNIICIPKAQIHHNTEYEENTKVSWKSYYILRNRLVTIKRHYPKRIYICMCLIEYIKKVSLLSILKRRSRSERMLYKNAIKDATNERLGIHKVYRPGWKG